MAVNRRDFFSAVAGCVAVPAVPIVAVGATAAVRNTVPAVFTIYDESDVVMATCTRDVRYLDLGHGEFMLRCEDIRFDPITVSGKLHRATMDVGGCCRRLPFAVGDWHARLGDTVTLTLTNGWYAGKEGD